MRRALTGLAIAASCNQLGIMNSGSMPPPSMAMLINTAQLRPAAERVRRPSTASRVMTPTKHSAVEVSATTSRPQLCGRTPKPSTATDTSVTCMITIAIRHAPALPAKIAKRETGATASRSKVPWLRSSTRLTAKVAAQASTAHKIPCGNVTA